MGYTQTWRRPEEIDPDTYQQIREDMLKVLSTLPDEHPSGSGQKLQLANYSGREAFDPDALDSDEFGFNGRIEAGDGGETFTFDRVREPSSRSQDEEGVYAFTKTGRNPYDLAVCSCLLVAQYHLGRDLKIESHRLYEDSWPAALEEFEITMGQEAFEELLETFKDHYPIRAVEARLGRPGLVGQYVEEREFSELLERATTPIATARKQDPPFRGTDFHGIKRILTDHPACGRNHLSGEAVDRLIADALDVSPRSTHREIPSYMMRQALPSAPEVFKRASNDRIEAFLEGINRETGKTLLLQTLTERLSDVLPARRFARLVQSHLERDEAVLTLLEHVPRTAVELLKIDEDDLQELLSSDDQQIRVRAIRASARMSKVQEALQEERLNTIQEESRPEGSNPSSRSHEPTRYKQGQLGL